MSDFEEPSELFEKPRGERRWLGREHHRGKERLFESVKDRTFIEKTVSSQESMSKKAVSRINDSTKDELELNVVYSLDKKNRWRDADAIKLLSSAPEGVNAEVVQKNGLEQFGFSYPNKSTFSVTSKVVSQQDSPGEFGIRSATSSGKGQDYSNFVAKSRELSKKANARVKIEEEEEESAEQQPTVSYNIYKTHRSVDAVGGQMFKAKVVSKSGKHRANKKIDMEVYEDFDDYYDDEEEENYPRRTEVNLADFEIVSSKNQKKQMKTEVPEETPDVLVIEDILNAEGYTFQEIEVVLDVTEDNFEQQMDWVTGKGMKVKELRKGQFLIDVSDWPQHERPKDGEPSIVIGISKLKDKKISVLINSTIASPPHKRNQTFWKKLFQKASSIHEAVKLIAGELRQNQKIIETMKLSSAFYKQKTFPEMLQNRDEWENQLVNMNWPNRHYHSTWANSKELSTVGTVLEWPDLCEMIRKPSRNSHVSAGSSCTLCGRMKGSLELLGTAEGVKCTGCLKKKFYKELRAGRIPIDLQTDCADELEILPTFIPLTIINFYVRLVIEDLFKATGSLRKCPPCKSTVYFKNAPEGQKTHQNRSCPCGYSWCRDCEKVPHWPMKCRQYAEWEDKWLLRYALKGAQGHGMETLLQVTCHCKLQIYYCRLPTTHVRCTGQTCWWYANLEGMEGDFRNFYILQKKVIQKPVEQKLYKLVGKPDHGLPVVTVRMDISKISKLIPVDVVKICGAARDARFDEVTRNRVANRIQQKKILEKQKAVENAMGTAAYLAEMVGAWMYVNNQYDETLEKALEELLWHREVLVDLLIRSSDLEGVKECLEKIRKGIDSVLEAVKART